MRYILRVIVHENAWERQLEDIVSLCKYAKIEEVFAKEQCHQILMSPVALEKDRRMADIYKKMAERCRQEGIKFSVNIATIIGHCDADLEEKDLLPYTHFVGDDLKERKTNYCILDEGWQNYASEKVSMYAESKPEILMIDDDFRSLNHSGFLGCFCDLHVERVAKIAGKPLTKETLLKHVKGNSEEDRRIRKIWQEVNFDGQKRAAKKISDAVYAVSPTTRVGLMNSGEANHSVQGRDMQELLEIFAGKNKPVSRPCGGAYSDETHREIISSIQGMSLSIAQLEGVEIISEVENWPHTRYRKSIAVTELQMQLHALANADAISMNIFDFMGTPYDREPRLKEMIKNIKPKLEEISALRKGKTQHGLGLLWRKDASVHKKDGLLPNRIADTLFPLLGLPTAFCESDVNFINGEISASLSDDEIRELLKKGLILDDGAFKDLVSRGFASYCGCDIEGEIWQVSAEKMLESEFAGEFANDLLPTDLLRLHLSGYNIPKIKVSDGAEVLTEILDRDYRKLGDGITVFENEVGGRVCVIPTKITDWTFLYRARAFMLRRIFMWLSRGKFDFVLNGGVNISPFYYVNGSNGDGLLALLNSGLDREPCSIDFKGQVLTLDGVDVNGKELICEPLSLTLLKTKK